MMQSIAGNKAMAAAISWERGRVKLVSTLDKYFARARFTKILQKIVGHLAQMRLPNRMMDSVPLTRNEKNTSNNSKMPKA